MQKFRPLRYTIQVFIFILFLLFSSPLFAGEIQGTVTEVEGKQVHIQVGADAGINIGDKAVIGAEIAGVGMVLIDAQWKVIKINSGSVIAESSKIPPSAPRPGYLVTITTSQQKTTQQDKFKRTIPQGTDSKSFRQYREKGLSARKQKNYIEAIKYFQKAEKLKPEDEDLMRSIAYTFYLQKEFNESINYCEKLIKLNQYEYKAYGILGINYKRLYDFPKAIESFKKVIELRYNDQAAMVNLVELNFKLKKYKNCQEYILMYEETINKENLSLLTEKRREVIRKTLDRFSHYKTVIKKNEL